jgi:hypothetical protein
MGRVECLERALGCERPSVVATAASLKANDVASSASPDIAPMTTSSRSRSWRRSPRDARRRRSQRLLARRPSARSHDDTALMAEAVDPTSESVRPRDAVIKHLLRDRDAAGGARTVGDGSLRVERSGRRFSSTDEWRSEIDASFEALGLAGAGALSDWMIEVILPAPNEPGAGTLARAVPLDARSATTQYWAER